MYGGQDYLKSQINWAVAGGSPGSAFKPFALAAGIDDGYSLKSTFNGNSPYVFPNGDQGRQRGTAATATTTARAVSLLTATEQSINTAFVDMTQSMDNGPQKIIEHRGEDGHPAERAGAPSPTSGISLGSATISPIDMANAYGTIAAGGKAKKWYVVSKVADANGKTRVQAPRSRPPGRSPTRLAATSATPCSRWSRPAPARTRWRWAARRPARPAPPPTPTATSPRRGSSATRRSSRPR